MKQKLVSIVTLILVLSALLVTAVAAAVQNGGANVVQDPLPDPLPEFTFTAPDWEQETLLDAAIRQEDGRISLIVELDAPALADYEGGVAGLDATSAAATGAGRLAVDSPASVAYMDYLAREQALFIEAATAVAPSVAAHYQYQALFNGVSLSIAPEELPALMELPGVAHIYPNTRQEIMMDASLPLINAPALWADLGGQDNAGDGVFVAIIDSGIRPENPLFADDGFTMPEGFPKGYCVDVPDDPDFACNNKLVAARYYTPTSSLPPGEVLSPLDIDGHGSHVAGTAVGMGGVAADMGDGVVETISGVAPGAYLMVYKALWYEEGGSDATLIAALNDAVLDGADVINNSWGGQVPYDAASPFKTVIDNAVDAGVVVVFAAGNSGPGAETIGCPGCVESAIAVAASHTGRVHANTFDVGDIPELSDLAAWNMGEEALAADVGPAPITFSGAVSPTNVLGCDPFPAGSFEGNIALIPRGICPFLDKANHAVAAGAVGVVFVNDRPGVPPYNIFPPAYVPAPLLILTDVDGAAVIQHVMANPGATGQMNAAVSRIMIDEFVDVIADFSSRGPNSEPNFLKPDITAPGVGIMSAVSPATSPGGAQFGLYDGTSMAAPHVAGAAALMRQLHPDWTVAQIKTALTSTAVRSLVKEDLTTPADPFDMGAGRIDLAAASQAGATFAQSSFANDDCFAGCVFSNTITNVSGQTSTWHASAHSDSGLVVTFNQTEATLADGETMDFEFQVDGRTVVPNQWHFAWIIWSESEGNAPDAYLPLAVYVTNTTDLDKLAKIALNNMIQPGEVISYVVAVNNISPLTQTYILTDYLPHNADYVPGTASGGLTYDSDTNTLGWIGDLAPATFAIGPGSSPFGYLPLASLGVPPLPCDEGLFDPTCDNEAYPLMDLDFYYLGEHYTDAWISTNGFMKAGMDTSSFEALMAEYQSMLTPINTDMPDATVPNNILAPFWTNLDMSNGEPGDTGAGSWYFVDDLSPDGVHFYTIIEWAGVEVQNVPGVSYSFQIWIEQGTDHIWFVYGSMPDIPDFLTVGAENTDGDWGAYYYYNGAGVPPAAGTDLQVAYAPSVQVMMYALEATAAPGNDVIFNVVALDDGSTIDAAWAATTVDFYDLFLPSVARP